MEQEQAASKPDRIAVVDGGLHRGPIPLEDRYSWEDLGKLMADRIEGANFLHKDNWSRHEFLKWFKIREKVGLRVDWRMVAREYAIWRKLRRGHDHFTVIVGTEGSGKSTMEIQHCAMIAPAMDLKDIVFDMPHYIKKLKEVAKHYKKFKKQFDDRSIGIDEGGISLFSREALSRSNKILAKSFMVQRFLNVHVCICIPHFWSLDTLIRNHRINTLIIIKRRGEYKCVVGKGIKILNRLGAKNKEKDILAIQVPYQYFWEGKFRKAFPKTVDYKEYEKHKFKHIQSFLDDAELVAKQQDMVSLKRIEKEIGVPEEELKLEINNGTIEGRRIGTKWFITRKAYKNLFNL